MRRTAWPVLLLCALMLSSACARSSDGVPTTQATQSAAVTTTSETPSATEDVPGVVPTPGPTAGRDCAPTSPATAQVRTGDPDAPSAVVGVPEGWTTAPAPEGLTLRGPAAMSATVTIAATPLDPAAAFRRYADDLTADTTMSTLSLLPAETCGFSGQKLMGMLGGTTPGSVDYEARIVHVPAAGSGYLIAVYAEAPVDTPGFDDAAAVLTGGIGIGLP